MLSTGGATQLMYRPTFKKSDFTPPSDPVLRIERANGCDGSECLLASFYVDGSPTEVQPHCHLIESQIGAWERPYPIEGPLPGDHYDS
jgi:hypothetical protein